MKYSCFKGANPKNRQSGIAVIELTLVLPFLLLLIFATAEFGRMLYQYNALNHLTRDALRYAINDVYDGDTVVSTGAVNAMVYETTNLLFYGQVPNLGDALPDEILPNIASSVVTLSKVNDYYVTISVTYYWQPLFSSSFNTFTSSNTIDLTFPLVINYTMRAI